MLVRTIVTRLNQSQQCLALLWSENQIRIFNIFFLRYDAVNLIIDCYIIDCAFELEVRRKTVLSIACINLMTSSVTMRAHQRLVVLALSNRRPSTKLRTPTSSSSFPASTTRLRINKIHKSSQISQRITIDLPLLFRQQ